MTSYDAYEAGLPCKNPSCKSHGKSHPNCRCYGNMADGGDVEPYCASPQPHRRECRYFKDGGAVNALDIPQHVNPNYSVAAYLAHNGLHNLIKMKGESPAKDLDKYNSSVERGHKLFDSKINALFGGDGGPEKDHEKAKDAIDSWIEKGGITNDIQDELYKQNEPQQFAEGGEVKKEEGILHQNYIATAYPEQNMMLQEAKGRASNYLNGLKPQPNQPKLAFDDAPDDTKQKKAYKEALNVAAHPLGVLEHVKKGTIEPEHLNHLKNLYPELQDTLQQKLTKRITEAQLKGEKPQRHIRQGLSLLMGVPLSGELSPSNIIAAQATFQAKKAQTSSPDSGKPHGKVSALSKSSQSLMTADQAAASRQQKQ